MQHSRVEKAPPEKIAVELTIRHNDKGPTIGELLRLITEYSKIESGESREAILGFIGRFSAPLDADSND